MHKELKEQVDTTDAEEQCPQCGTMRELENSPAKADCSDYRPPPEGTEERVTDFEDVLHGLGFIALGAMCLPGTGRLQGLPFRGVPKKLCSGNGI